MKTKLGHVMTSAVLTGAMVLSMSGMSAFADDPITPVTGIGFSKVVTTDGHTYAPNTGFKFELSPAGAVTQGNISIKAGVADGIVLSNVVDGGSIENEEYVIKFTPDGPAGPSASYTKNGAITVDLSKFDSAGVYHYTIKEVVPEESARYSGIMYDERVHDVYVTILNGTGNTLFCGGIRTALNGDLENKEAALVFTNDYGFDESTNDSTHDVKITKIVTGNQAEMNKAFEFAVKVTSDQPGELFKYEAPGVTGGYLVAGAEAITISLKDGEFIRIYGLTKGDVVDVHEDEKYQGLADGKYTVTSIVDSNKITADSTDPGSNRGFVGTVKADDAQASVTNDKTVGAATGVALTFGPYALMVMLAGVFAAMFLRKKKSVEEF